jgi:hypothetical protein
MNDKVFNLFDPHTDLDTRLQSAQAHIERLSTKNKTYEDEISRLNEIITLLKNRKNVYLNAQKMNPKRFINGIKNFEIETKVEFLSYRTRN